MRVIRGQETAGVSSALWAIGLAEHQVAVEKCYIYPKVTYTPEEKPGQRTTASLWTLGLQAGPEAGIRPVYLPIERSLC